MSAISSQVQRSWTKVSPLLQIRNEDGYDLAVERLHALLDEVGTDEKHPLYSLLDTLGTVLHAYEEENHPMPKARGGEMLRFLMAEHHLTQSELPEIGTQGVVSDILRRKRELNVRQIRALSKRFNVSPSVFF